MKTLNTILTLSLLVVSTVSFAAVADKGSDNRNNIPLAPSVWSSAEIETPELLKYVKAKNAFVPVAEFVWGNASEIPANLSMVPVAPFTLGDSMDSAPEELAFIKAKSGLVPVAPFVWGDASEEVIVK
ncbi:MAG: hypothetical protein V4721_13585 [Bacteroidota bacterium]